MENSTATFELSVSHDNVPVKWMFNNVELKPSSKCKVISERKVHKLILENITSAQVGEYSAIIGQLECKAKLYVDCECKTIFFCFTKEKFK